MKIILVGYGNVGKELERVIKEQSLLVDIIVRSDGIYNSTGVKIDELTNFNNYVDRDTVVFISTPSKGKGELSADYYLISLEQGATIITCEKAFLATHWEVVLQYPKQIKYSATVGGGSGILNAISGHQGEIREIQAVINGTLNYTGDRLAQGILEETVYKEVIDRGFAEPGASNFNEVIEGELKDVQYKTVILANHSKLYQTTVALKDVTLAPYSKGLRCLVTLTKDGIKGGFVEESDAFQFPSGVNNCLYINGQKIVEGPGAGARATAERMFEDLV